MAKQKSFKDNPALQFITQPEPEEPEQTIPQTPPGKPPAGYKLDPRFVELKTKRLQLVLQPSLVERVKDKAFSQHLSVNEFISRLLEEATKEK